MPLISLLDFLQTGELRFSRADKFEDTQEGHVGLEALLSTMPSELHEKARQALHRQNLECFVSCWHLSSSESLAMWKIYGANAFSVAVVSNVGKVMSACHHYCTDSSAAGMFGEVVYDDYVSNGTLNVQTLGIPFGYKELPISKSTLTLFMKAKAFSYEQEWRVVLNKKNTSDPAIRVPIGEIEEFIEQVYVSPQAPDWMVSTIESLVRDQFGFNRISVSRSPLAKHFKI
jgi:hypothetical protein